ncbi:MAG: glycosyltransferase [Desulfobacteraceae bacterium]|nr:glycosyltransferase [Desulfobacteraceae bacterium]
MMAVCDFIVLPSTDETQSGTLAQIMALNKPYITTAPLEGLTAQTLEKVIRLACDEKLRLDLGENLKQYLDDVVSWDVVCKLYNRAYDLAREAKRKSSPVVLNTEF